MANDGEWRTGQYLVEGVKVIKCCHPRMLTPGGGTHMLRHTGMCRPNGLLFQQKSLDMGPILVKKILKRGSHFAKIAKKW